MAVAFRGGSANSAVNGGNVAFNLTTLSGSPSSSSIADGDFIVMAYVLSTTSDKGMSQTGPSLTEQLELYANGSVADTNFAVYTGFWHTGDSTTLTAIGDGVNASATSAAVFVFSGVDPTTPLDVAIQTATGTGTALPNAPAVTPVTAGAYIVEAVGAAGAAVSALTNPGDLSSAANKYRTSFVGDTTDSVIAIGVKEDWASGAFDPAAFTAGGSNAAGDSWAAATLVLRPAAAPTSTPKTSFYMY